MDMKLYGTRSTMFNFMLYLMIALIYQKIYCTQKDSNVRQLKTKLCLSFVKLTHRVDLIEIDLKLKLRRN